MVKNLIWLNTEILCGGFYENRRLKVVHVFYNHMYQSKVQFRIPVLSIFFFYKYFVVCICYIYIYTVKFRSWKATFLFSLDHACKSIVWWSQNLPIRQLFLLSTTNGRFSHKHVFCYDSPSQINNTSFIYTLYYKMLAYLTMLCSIRIVKCLRRIGLHF